MSESIKLPPLPMSMHWLTPPASWQANADGGLRIKANAGTDLFTDPAGQPGAVHNAPSLLGTPTGDFQLSARITVDFRSTFDAGVLLLWADERAWAKLCFEYSPQGTPMVVSVVTRGSSDDCNSMAVERTQVWLRISRLGGAFAFHASADGRYWQFVRYFALDAENVRVGFLAQSPTGQGAAATFDTIRYTPEPLPDLRDGR